MSKIIWGTGGIKAKKHDRKALKKMLLEVLYIYIYIYGIQNKKETLFNVSVVCFAAL